MLQEELDEQTELALTGDWVAQAGGQLLEIDGQRIEIEQAKPRDTRLICGTSAVGDVAQPGYHAAPITA